MKSATHAKPRVLVVHDCAEVRSQIRDFLGASVAVEEAADARQALAAATSTPVDVILFEANLLIRDRGRALTNLRADTRTAQTPILVISGPDAEQARHAALTAGADDYIRMPFDAVDLWARLNVHLRVLTARRQVEQELHDKEARLRTALTASGAGVFRWDMRSGAVEWDESLDRLFGFPPGQTIGSLEAFLAMIHAGERQQVIEGVTRSAREGADLDMEYRIHRADGQERWVYDRGKVFFDEHGRPSYMMGACLDITARKRVELRKQFEVDLETALRPLDDAAHITASAARLLGEYLEVNRCAYADVEADQNTFNLTGDYTCDVPSVVGRYQFEQFGREVLRLMRAGDPYVVDDVDSHQPAPESLLAFRQMSIQAVICVPLHKNGKLVAAMAVHQKAPRKWNQDDVELVQYVANRSWESIERTRVSRELKESESRFRQLADSVPLIVWEARPDGTVDYFNERWYQFTGFDRGATGDSSWEPILHPDDVAKTRDAWHEAVRSGRRYEVEYRFKDRRTGGHRWFIGRALPVTDSRGKVVRWFGTCTDIHEAKLVQESLKANEDRLRAIIEATPECVKIVSRDGAIMEINRSGLKMIEAESEDEVRNAPALEFVAPKYRQQWMENHERACMGESLRWEYEVVTKRGTRRWIEAHAVPVALPGGERAQLSVARDITSRKRIEVEREQLLHAERAARAEAEQLGRIKDEFLGTLSHELRTPLNAILGFATLMQMADMEPAERKEALATIERNARLQAKLVDDLLDMNRILTGKIRLDVQAFSPSDVIRAAMETVRPSAAAKGIELQTDFDCSVGPVCGDAERLQQVLWNLLSNAVKFNRRGGWARVSLQRVASHVEISVSDSGEGIAPEFLPHVFDRFRQADSSTTRKYGGLGLGLSIVRHIVELHGGIVRAESAGRGQGSVFTISLPLQAIDASSAARQTDSPRVAAYVNGECAVDLAGVTVLAVDDEPDSSRMVKRVLEECGATVETANSAREALQLLHQRQFEVLVSDIGMPVEDGYDLMRAVRSLGGAAREVRSVALTAFARPEDRHRANLAGFQAHVSKPIEAADLIVVVAELAGRLPAQASDAS